MTAGGTYRPSWHGEDTEALASLTTAFMRKEFVPHRERFEEQQHVDRELWRSAGEHGLLCCAVPIEFGGPGGELVHDLAVLEAHTRMADATWGNMVHSGIVSHYILAFGTEEQKHRWLPGMVAGDLVAAIAMTEPGTGSDLQAITTRAKREGTEYVINGAKTFISNGYLADLVIVVASTDPAAGHRGISLIVVETAGCPGFSRGRMLRKLGSHSADTSELFFDDVRVPATNLLGGEEGRGFVQLMEQLPQERLLIGLQAAGMTALALEETIAYTKSRQAFGRSVFDNQNTQFVLAEAATKADAARVFLDWCIGRHLAGQLTAATAAQCKWLLTEVLCEVVDQCLQLFGGYGYMTEYPIARLYADARATKIFGGTNEIMRQVIAKSL
ncbi:putative acyl CoA dehydrogenase [Acrocarpospora pleiomorpha]|uniref:Acyl-[acyl-carrier-protein] dehydrogenase MbtN n=1 Tax=Acrocarpospora pleiomorpha TaxID=90975 RepID=A0A5M3X665_9ACTN|nr:acyl-CoA dehydrogenase family protein [Acrocarpospora pleiomorpha]GES17177.1 putative acyl CoA dehydrogenase [Acrocarpospora pleiomorpha]